MATYTVHRIKVVDKGGKVLIAKVEGYLYNPTDPSFEPIWISAETDGSAKFEVRYELPIGEGIELSILGKKSGYIFDGFIYTKTKPARNFVQQEYYTYFGAWTKISGDLVINADAVVPPKEREKRIEREAPEFVEEETKENKEGPGYNPFTYDKIDIRYASEFTGLDLAPRSYNIRWSGRGTYLPRKAFNKKYAWIGLSRLPIVSKIETHVSSNSPEVKVPRQAKSIFGGIWSQSEMILITIEFPNTLYDEAAMGEDVTYDQVAELRTLIAQLRVSPFLPVNWGEDALQSVAHVDALAIEQVIISTKEGSPESFTVEIAASPFNWKVYLKDPDKNSFSDYFVWPIFNQYIKSVVESSMDFIPHTDKFEMSIANERLATTLRRFIHLSSSVAGANLNKDPGFSPDKYQVASWLKIYKEDLDQLANHPDMLLDPKKIDRERYRKITIRSRRLLSDHRIARILAPSGRRLIKHDEDGELTFTVTKEAHIRIHKRALELLEQDKILFEAHDSGYITGSLFDHEREQLVSNKIQVQAIQIILSNQITHLKSAGYQAPTMQFWGSPDAQVSIYLSSNTGLAHIKESFQRSIVQRNRTKSVYTDDTGDEPGFVQIKTPLLSALGFKNFVPKNITVTSTEGFPGREDGRFDLDVFFPATDDTKTITNLINNDDVRIVVGNRRTDDTNWRIGKVSKTEKMLRKIPLYPDLYLPTYATVFKWIHEAGLSVKFQLPISVTLGTYVDPDFYINCYDPQDSGFLNQNYIFENMDKSMTISSRRLYEETVSILASKDPPIRQAEKPEGLTTVDVPKVIDPNKPVKMYYYPGRHSAPDDPEETWQDYRVQPPGVTAATEQPVKRVPKISSAPDDPEITWVDSLEEEQSVPVVVPPPETQESEVAPRVHNKIPKDVETKPEEDPIIPWDSYKCAVDSFEDYRKQPTNRLVRAFPTMLALFYREGMTFGVKRLWDQFFGKVALFDVSVYSSMYKPESTATLSIASPNAGMMTSDAIATESVYLYGDDPVTKSETGDSMDGAIAFEVDEYEYMDTAEDYDIKLEEKTKRKMFNAGPTSDAGFNRIKQRWRDLANVLSISTGTRLHIRMGYGSQVHMMDIVFNGTVVETEISQDRIDCVAVGDGVELDINLSQVETVTLGEEASGNTWETTSPRAFILSVIGKYDKYKQFWSGTFRPGPENVSFEENPYGIRHFGYPLFQKYRKSYRHLHYNLSELGQNIYSAAWAEVDEGADVRRAFLDPAPLIEGSNESTSGSPDQITILDREEYEQLNVGLLKPFSKTVRTEFSAGLSQRLVGGVVPDFIEDQYVFNIADKTFWETITELAHCTPGYITAVRPFGVYRSTLFWGKPYWHYSYNYINRSELLPGFNVKDITQNHDGRARGDLIDQPREGGVYEINETHVQLQKVFAQTHICHSLFDLVTMKLRATNETVATDCRVFGLNEDGSWQDIAFGEAYSVGINTVICKVDDDILPELTNVIDVQLPFQWDADTSEYGRKKAKHYGQARLAETVRTMYDGHILMLGNGSIFPWNNIFITDHTTETVGLCTVREVQHTISMATGFTTDVKPGAVAWASIAITNLETLITITAGAQLMAYAMTMNTMDTQLKQYLISYGSSQITRILKLIKHTNINLEKEIKALTECLEDLQETVTEDQVGAIFAIVNDLIIDVLIRIEEQFRTFDILSGQYITPQDLVLELSEIRKSLAGSAKNGSIGVGYGYARGGNESARTIVKDFVENIEKQRRQMLHQASRLEGDLDPGAKLASVHSEGLGSTWGKELGGLPIVAPTARLFLRDRKVDGVGIFLLTRSGREISAGIDGHRGSVIGEPGNGWDEFKTKARRWFGLGRQGL